MSAYDDILAELDSEPLHDIRSRVKVRLEAEVKAIMARPDVKLRIDKEVERRVRNRVEARFLKHTANALESWLDGWIEDCSYEEELKTRGLVDLIMAVFPNRADRDRLFRKYGIRRHLCLRCGAKLYGQDATARVITPEKKEETKTKTEVAPGGPGKRGPKAPSTTYPKRKDK